MNIVHNTYNIRPSLWGPRFWSTIFSFVAVYPEIPNTEQSNSAKKFFESLQYLIPCNKCKQSYNLYIAEDDTFGTNIQNPSTFSSRDNLINFVYNLREKVNKKITMEYCISLEYFKKKLNYMKCDNNKLDYMIYNLSEAPFIQKSEEIKIYKYLEKNKDFIENYDSIYTSKLMTKLKKFIENPIFDINNKNFKLWILRNKVCRILINKINIEKSKYDYNVQESFLNNKKLYLYLFYIGCNIMSINDLQLILNID
jgi:hypothetical protein